ARALAAGGLLLLQPVPQRDIGDPQILRQPPLRLVAELRQADRLTAELLRIQRPRSGHLNLTFPGLRPEVSKCRRKRVKSSSLLEEHQPADGLRRPTTGLGGVDCWSAQRKQ